MCGIFCSLGDKSEDLDIRKVLKLQNHRGPDFNDYIKIDNLILASNRLKIIDLSNSANMPLKHGPITIVFNGFISNFKILKQEMIEFGINFETSSDTEVLAAMLHVYEYDTCFKKLEGMWAFIAYNNNDKNLIISRDDFGIKPLFYYKDEKNLIFASEVNTLASILNLEKDLSNLKNFFFDNSSNYDFCATEKTFFKNVFNFPKKKFLIINTQKKIKKIEFHNIERNYPKHKLDENEYYELLKKKFDDYGVSDTAKCIPLSAGIDSNLIYYFYKNHQNTSLFSIIDKDIFTDNNEYTLIKKISKKILLPHEFIETDKIITFDFFKNIIHKFKSPISSPVLLNSAALRYHANRKNIKILYSGNGGDEIFGGYIQQFIYILQNLLKNKKYFKFFKLFIQGSKFASSNKNVNINIRHNISGLKSLYKSVFSNNFFHNTKIQKNNNFFYKEFNFNSDENLKFFSATDFNMHLINDKRMPYWLSSDDFISSMYSIENRVPFLNQELIALSQNIYDEDNFKFGNSKYKIRKLFKNKIFDEVLDNKIKLNSPGSFDNFLFGKFYENILETFKKSTFFKKDIIIELHKNRIEFDRMKNGYKNNFSLIKNSSFLFKALSFEIFLQS